MQLKVRKQRGLDRVILSDEALCRGQVVYSTTTSMHSASGFHQAATRQREPASAI